MAHNRRCVVGIRRTSYSTYYAYTTESKWQKVLWAFFQAMYWYSRRDRHFRFVFFFVRAQNTHTHYTDKKTTFKPKRLPKRVGILLNEIRSECWVAIRMNGSHEVWIQKKIKRKNTTQQQKKCKTPSVRDSRLIRCVSFSTITWGK